MRPLMRLRQEVTSALGQCTRSRYWLIIRYPVINPAAIPFADSLSGCQRPFILSRRVESGCLMV